jgi:hypothetical protein
VVHLVETVHPAVEVLVMLVVEVKAEVVVQMGTSVPHITGGLVLELMHLIMLLFLLVVYYQPGQAEQLEIAHMLEAEGREVL